MQRNIIWAFVVSMALLPGCSKNIVSNEKPVLVEVLHDLAVETGDSITLDLTVVEAWTPNGKELTLVVRDGENYSVYGSTVVPDQGFIGDLEVPLCVSNGATHSNELPIIISVVAALNIVPFVHAFEWEYTDTVFSDSTVSHSMLVVDTSIQVSASGYSGSSLHSLRWITKDSVGLNYLYYDSVGYGNMQIGAFTATDTVFEPGLRLKYPVTRGESWDYRPLLYNITDETFVTDTTVKQMRCTNTRTYVRVPAGVFECIEYEYSSTVQSGNDNGVALKKIISTVTGLNQNKVTQIGSSQSYTRTIKLYYSPGIGYVQYLMYADSVLIKKKALTDYTVVESADNLTKAGM